MRPSDVPGFCSRRADGAMPQVIDGIGQYGCPASDRTAMCEFGIHGGLAQREPPVAVIRISEYPCARIDARAAISRRWCARVAQPAGSGRHLSATGKLAFRVQAQL